MKLTDAMLRIQYDQNWLIYARAIEPEADAQYTQASNRNDILEAQGWTYVADGVTIGDAIADYCEGVLGNDRATFARKAVEALITELAAEIADYSPVQI